MEITYMNEFGAVYVDCDDVHITLAMTNEFAMYYPDLEFDFAVVCVEFLRRINGIENVIHWAEEIENE